MLVIFWAQITSNVVFIACAVCWRVAVPSAVLAHKPFPAFTWHRCLDLTTMQDNLKTTNRWVCHVIEGGVSWKWFTLWITAQMHCSLPIGLARDH